MMNDNNYISQPGRSMPKNDAIDTTIEKFFSAQNLPRFKSLQNLNGSERIRIYPQISPRIDSIDEPNQTRLFAHRPEKYYCIVTDNLEYPDSSTQTHQRMTQQHCSTSTQDVRTAHYKKSSLRSRRARLPASGPSTSDSRRSISQFSEASTYSRNDSNFNRSDVRRKSTVRKLQQLVRRYLGLNVKDEQSQRPVNISSEIPYQPPRNHGLYLDGNHPVYLRRESFLRTGVRSSSKSAVRIRSNSSGTQIVQRPHVPNSHTDNTQEQSSTMERSLRRNNSLTNAQRSKRSQLLNSESAPENILRSNDERNGRHNGHQDKMSQSGSNRTFIDDPESGFDSPTDSKIFSPSMPCMKGLPNLGNTCYMNSILQCLSAADTLAEYFVTNTFLNDLKVKESSDSVALAFKKVLEALWRNDLTDECIRDFRSVIALYNDVYGTNYQQDAQELLDWLLDKLHEELDFPSSWDASDITGHRSAESPALSLHRKVHRSAVTNIFSASFRSSIECINCAFKAVKFDPFICVSLQVPEQELHVFVTLAELIRPNSLVCFGMKVKVEGRIRDVEECIKVQIDNRNPLAVMELDNFGFTFLQNGRTIMTLNSNDLFALEVTPFPMDYITIIFAVVDSSGNGERDRDHGARVTYPFSCPVHRQATYEHICNSLFEVIRTSGGTDLHMKFPDLRVCRLVVFDKYKTPSTLDPCVSMPLYTAAVDDSLFELRDGNNVSTLALQLLFKTPDTTFLRCLRSEPRDIKYHRSYHVLKELGTSTTLTDCLREYTRPEHLDWTCSMCGRKGGEKVMKFHSLPDVLVFHLKRFRRLEDGSMVKLAREIDFPTTGLDMSPYVYRKNHENIEDVTNGISRFDNNPGLPQHQNCQPRTTSDAIFVDTTVSNPYIYDLFAIVHHMGTSLDSGHYTATTKNPMDYKWRYFDDMIVRDLSSPNETETSTVYLLFYERCSAKRQMNWSSSGHSSTESGIQEHWFNRRAVDLTIKTKWNTPRGGNEESGKCLTSQNNSPSLSSRQCKRKDGSPVVGFQRNDIGRNPHVPSSFDARSHFQSFRNREQLMKSNTAEQNVWC